MPKGIPRASNTKTIIQALIVICWLLTVVLTWMVARIPVNVKRDIAIATLVLKSDICLKGSSIGVEISEEPLRITCVKDALPYKPYKKPRKRVKPKKNKI